MGVAEHQGGDNLGLDTKIFLDLGGREEEFNAGDYLDDQREEIIPEMDYYTTHATSVKDLKRGMSEFLLSEEGRKQFLS